MTKRKRWREGRVSDRFDMLMRLRKVKIDPLRLLEGNSISYLRGRIVMKFELI